MTLKFFNMKSQVRNHISSGKDVKYKEVSYSPFIMYQWCRYPDSRLYCCHLFKSKNKKNCKRKKKRILERSSSTTNTNVIFLNGCPLHDINSRTIAKLTDLNLLNSTKRSFNSSIAFILNASHISKWRPVHLGKLIKCFLVT